MDLGGIKGPLPRDRRLQRVLLFSLGTVGGHAFHPLLLLLLGGGRGDTSFMFELKFSFHPL